MLFTSWGSEMRNNRVIKWYEPSKYRNEKTEVDGIVFDSRKEANRYRELKLLEKAGEISDLRLQVKFELVPAIYEYGVCIPRAVCVQKAVTYIADFVYRDKMTGEEIVEDVKGMKTEVYKLKKKLLRWRYGIEIKEV